MCQVCQGSGDLTPHSTLAISSRAHMRELFGEAGLANESTRYDVSVDPEERNVLVLVRQEQ